MSLKHTQTLTHLSTCPPISCWIIIKLTPTTLREEKEKIKHGEGEKEEEEEEEKKEEKKEEREEEKEEEGGSGKREDTLDKDIPSVLMVESL